ncbi:hypothetical protein ACSAZK_13475 [Methanosarcina sp. Mfa9]|uniref:hypothetical protein n=1 Tax=Methanosarcina sp. Mfa9 TaxID=3439063 RepID=UPI003F858B6D
MMIIGGIGLDMLREKNKQVTPQKIRIVKNRKVLASGLITRSLLLFFSFSSEKL